MICFEEKLRELVDLMPDLVNDNGTFPIRYDWGTQDVLNKFLLISENVSKYPLIWLVTGKDSDDLLRDRVTRNTRLVIAVNSLNPDAFNEKQYQTDYVNIIIPIYQNLIKLLERSGASKIIDSSVDKELRPNYSVNDNGKGLITIWNALVLDLRIELTNKCLNTNIKF